MGLPREGLARVRLRQRLGGVLGGVGLREARALRAGGARPGGGA